MWPAAPPDWSSLLTALLLHFQPAAALTHYPVPPPIAPGAPLTALLFYSSLLLPLNALTIYPIPPLIAPAALFTASAAYGIAALLWPAASPDC
jgi:hypothetical protein